jgi:exodeoxyribonuclease-3
VPEPPAFVHPIFDVEQRACAATLPTAGGEVTVASLYVPNGGKDYPAKLRFLEGIETWVAEAEGAGRGLLLCGDLNVAREERDVHPKERKPHQIGTRPEERELLERLLGEGLVDVGRAVDPDNDALFTWWAPWRTLRQRNIGWRIDYVLASEALAGGGPSCVVQREVGTSDHGPVVAVLPAAG